MAFNWRRAADIAIAVGGGHIPTKRYFSRITTGSIWVAATGIHSNPRFYKYHWRIWTAEETVDDDWRRGGRAYPWLDTTPRLTFLKGIERMRYLVAINEKFLVIHDACKRADDAAPWDIESLRRDGKEVAPALADDLDPEFHGHR